jgi:hypothetical protein
VLVVGCLSEVYFFHNPQQTTPIDLVFNEMPLHRQFTVMRNIASVVVAIILSIHSRKPTKDRQILKDLPQLLNQAEKAK